MMPFFLFQFDIASDAVSDSSAQAVSLLSDPIAAPVMGLVVSALFVLVILYLIRWLFHRHSVQLGSAFRSQVLLVRVPKELKKEDGQQEKSQQQIQELIGHMETVFATIGSLRAQRGIIHWLTGRSDAMSFEIVAHRDKISFYVSVPSSKRSFIEEQIHAQYPNAQIEDVPDYNIFSPKGIIIGSYLTFRRDAYFPIRTYRKLETDSINSLTNALSKVDHDDGVAIQYIVRSANPGWRTEGVHIAREMQQGKKLEDVERRGLLWGVWRELKKMAVLAKPGEDAKPEAYRLSPLEEEMVKGLEEKSSKAGLDANIRILVCAKTPEKAQGYLNDILDAYGQFNIYEYGNSFSKNMPLRQARIIRHFIFRLFDPSFRLVLNAEEMATIFHFPLHTTETPKINWLLSRKALPPPNLPTEGLLLGLSEYRGHNYEVRMKQGDRRRHMYIIGKSGSGKSVYQASLIKQDIEDGRGVCVIDPHGDLVDECLEYVPKERAEDVIYFDPADIDRPIGINMLEFDPKRPHLRTFVINEMLKIFDKLYDLKATGGPMFEVYTRNAILLLMDHPESGSTLMDVPRVLADEDYRNFKLSKCQSQEVKDFWTKEALKAGGDSSLANMVPYITSKFASFIYNDYMRPIISQQESAFNFYEAMNTQKILLVKLSKGKIGDLNAYLLGMIFVGKILDAALGRASLPPEDRKDFYLYIDEFQNFLTDSINAILSEARKYGLNLIIAHQFIGQLTGANNDTKIRDSIFGNVGTLVTFRVGVEDAEFLEKEYAPVFSLYDLVNVEAFTCNVKLLIDNTASRPFNMKPVMPKRPENKELSDMIRELSRYKYGRKRELIEAEILERREMVMSDFF